MSIKLGPLVALYALITMASNSSFAQQFEGNFRVEQASVQSSQKSTIRVERLSPAIAKVHFANPPINLIVPETISSLNTAVKELSQDENIKVVIFVSDKKNYFFNHFDTSRFPEFLSQVGENGKPLWVELITNLAKAPFVTIGNINGRTQGGGNELTLAFDLRYASLERAVFNQPEVGIGLFPGGGGTDMLGKLVGRDRALEVFLSADDYTAKLAEKYGWVTRAMPEGHLNKFVDRLAKRLATFDRTALATTKAHINRIEFPNEAKLLSSYDQFVKSVSWPGLQIRIPLIYKMYQDVGLEEVESNLGYYIGEINKQIQ